MRSLHILQKKMCCCALGCILSEKSWTVVCSHGTERKEVREYLHSNLLMLFGSFFQTICIISKVVIFVHYKTIAI
jgi:hypothetical protein